MKIKISVSSAEWLETAKQYFDEKALTRAMHQNSLSRTALVELKCADFLRLASPGHDEIKEKTAKDLLQSRTRFESLPYLGVVTLENGDVSVVGNGGDHEGRHRAKALLNQGVTTIPVLLHNTEAGSSFAYRWGNTKRRPKLLIGYNAYSIPFPKIYQYD